MEPRPPAYRIETERLVIRCWRPSDLDALHDAVTSSRTHLLPWMEWAKQEPISRRERLEFLRDSRGKFDTDADYVYGIFDAEESKVIGGTGLHKRRGPQTREIGYWIREDSTRRGFATETTAALTRVGFEVDDLDRIELRVAPDNAASAGIPEALGFQREGTLRNVRPSETRDEPLDLIVWSMTPEDYQKADASDYDCRAYGAVGNAFSLSDDRP